MRTPDSTSSDLHRRVGPIALALAALGGACQTVPAPLPSISDDIREVSSGMLHDFGDVYGDWQNVALLAGAGVIALVAEVEPVENAVEEFAHGSSVLGEDGHEWLASAGDGLWLFVATGLTYSGARMAGDAHLHKSSKLAFRSLAVTGISTLVLKAALDDPRPDTGTLQGFPSGHSAMSMAFATSVYEAYGWKAGVPAYLLAAAVGLQRLDSRRHDLDDVVFGWSLGYIVTSTIFENSAPEILGFQVEPVIEPRAGFVGLGLSINF